MRSIPSKNYPENKSEIGRWKWRGVTSERSTGTWSACHWNSAHTQAFGELLEVGGLEAASLECVWAKVGEGGGGVLVGDH